MKQAVPLAAAAMSIVLRPMPALLLTIGVAVGWTTTTLVVYRSALAVKTLPKLLGTLARPVVVPSLQFPR